MFSPAVAAAPQNMDMLMQNLGRMLKQNGEMTPEQWEAQRKKLQMGVVAMKMHKCVEDAVGKPRLDAFMDDMNVVGKTIENYCKNQMADEALGLALGTLKAKQNDPVAIAARNCYAEHKIELEPLLDDRMTTDSANYERWASDVSLAEQEAKLTDICK